MTIKRHPGRNLQLQKVRANALTLAKQAAFLSKFGATCNLRASALAVGIRPNAVYALRRRDQAFRDAFAIAEDEGIFNLRNEMLRRSLAFLQAVTPDEKALASLAGVDCATILHLLKYHERGVGKAPGDRRPKRSDSSEAAANLHGLMIRMRAERKRELAIKRAVRAARTRALDEGSPPFSADAEMSL